MILQQPAWSKSTRHLLIINSYSLCAFQSLHTKVVHQYQHHYRDGPPTSGDEECLYWIRFLTYHMAKANLSQVTLTHINVLENFWKQFSKKHTQRFILHISIV